jgi:hypothetical protein
VFHVSQRPSIIIDRITSNNHIYKISRNDLKQENISPFLSRLISPEKLNKKYNIPTNQGSVKASQSVFETIDQYYSPSDIYDFGKFFSLNLNNNIKNIKDRASDSICREFPEACIEANLDLEYLLSISQNTPTTLW